MTLRWMIGEQFTDGDGGIGYRYRQPTTEEWADTLRKAWNEALDGHPERLRDPWPYVVACLMGEDE